MKTHAYTDYNICYFCGLAEPINIKKSYRKLVEQHHIVFKENNGSNEPSNLVPCCSTCHSKIHLNLIIIDKWINFGYAMKLHWFNEKGKEFYGCGFSC